MITVTSTPLATTTLTPATDGVANSAVSTTTPNEGFTNALTAQLGLTPAVDENGTAVLTQPQILTPAQAALLATTTSENAAPMTILSMQQPASLVDTAIETPLALNLPTDLPENVLSAQDEAILSNVTDTLKFIATGSKLGDTLQTGQSVKLPNANFSTPIKGQSIQTVVSQTLENPQVNTAAAVLAQQATPVSVGQTAIPSPQAELDPTVILSQVETAEKPTVTTQAQVQTPAVQAETAEKSVAATQTQTPVVQVQAAEQPTVTTQAQVQTPVVQAQTTQAQVQTPVVQAETVEKPVATTQVQTPVVQVQVQVQVQAETAEKPVVTTQAQVQTPVVQAQPAVTTQAQVQTPVVQVQAQTTEKPVVTTQAQVQTPVVQAQAETTEKPVVTTQTPVEKILPAIQPEITQQAVSQQVEKTQKPVQTADENAPIIDPALLTQTVTQNVVIQEKAIEPEAKKPQTQQAENKSENQDPQPIQVATLSLAPIVTAQATPIQVEADVPTFETPVSSSTPEDKPTLTPAKNLLADAIANRANGGDTAANSGDKKGSDTPANSTLQATDNSLKNSADSRQILDTKPFASLLAAEKSDTATVTSTAQTATVEKSAPQVMAAVGKLAETVKPEVPALTRPLSHPNWGEEVGERIVWMNNRNISSAEIRMNPQNLGPITVRIDMNQDQATIAFTAQNADVRSALEASIPKLREMLTSQNVNLADVNVSQQSSTSADSGRSQQQAAQMAADASANGQGGNRQNQNVEIDANGNPIRSVNANGEEIGVDEFANGQVLQDNGANGLLSLFA